MTFSLFGLFLVFSSMNEEIQSLLDVKKSMDPIMSMFVIFMRYVGELQLLESFTV